jgi:hypothetical protein
LKQVVDYYEKLQSALIMLKLLATGESDVQKGRLTDHDDVMKSIKQKLKSND